MGEPKSPTLANDWWQRAAKLGNREASYQLGMDCQLHHKGKLVSECLDWFKQAAKQDHAQAQLILGQWYAKQSGADTEAIKWLEKAAEQGNRDAQYQVWLRYEQEKGDDIKREEYRSETGAVLVCNTNSVGELVNNKK